ncbi:hypothetical protein J3E74DRAFT_413762 [Bipolaris maydis]|nr:hypothetical protein J3E74DRAFT_413762 [Bipolaris maydis]
MHRLLLISILQVLAAAAIPHPQASERLNSPTHFALGDLTNIDCLPYRLDVSQHPSHSDTLDRAPTRRTTVKMTTTTTLRQIAKSLEEAAPRAHSSSSPSSARSAGHGSVPMLGY